VFAFCPQQSRELEHLLLNSRLQEDEIISAVIARHPQVTLSFQISENLTIASSSLLLIGLVLVSLLVVLR
jgi:hypothetical protein